MCAELYQIILIYHNPSKWRCMTATTALSRSTSLAWWLLECLACPRFGSRHVVSCRWKKTAASVGSSRFPHRSAGHGPVRGTARPWCGNDWLFKVNPTNDDCKQSVLEKNQGKHKNIRTDRTRTRANFFSSSPSLQTQPGCFFKTISSKKERITNLPICSMVLEYITIIYPINGPNVGKYTIHGAYGCIRWYK